MKKLVIVGCLTAFLFASAGEVFAAKRGWVHLGDRSVTDRVDHDVFVVEGAKRELRAIKFAVRKRAVEIRRIKIVFANGKTQEHKLRAVIPAGGESRVIDLVGDERIVTQVEFWYDAQSRGETAVVKLFGKK